MDARLPEERPRPTRATWIVALTVAAAGYLVWQFVPNSGALLDPQAQPRSVAARPELLPDEKRITQLFQTASPSVVSLNSRSLARAPIDPSGRLARYDPTVIQEGTGSGFVWDDEGHVVTNFHVVWDAANRRVYPPDQLSVTFANHESYAAEVVGTELEKDIAVVKIDAPKEVLPPIAVGSSSDLLVGQSVYAIGNPFGVGQTLTHGIISGLDRDMPAKYWEAGRGQHWITGVIQTDAAINPGNSGGPLLDSAGRLIGMNTSIKSDTGENTGVGFAIPVDTINRIVTDILRYGQARRPGLGVRVTDFPTHQGVLINEVIKGSAAEDAGIRGMETQRDGDEVVAYLSSIIVGVNGKAVNTTEDLFRELDRHQVGDKIHLEVAHCRIDRTGLHLDGKATGVDVALQYLQPQ